VSRPQWWTREQFESEGIQNAQHAQQLITKMLRDARQVFPMETDTELRRIIAAKLGISLRTVLNWTR
jgi:hypothetical protein